MKQRCKSRGLQPSKGGAPTNDFAKFSEKLHEIKKILGGGGSGTRSDPLRSPLKREVDFNKTPVPARHMEEKNDAVLQSGGGTVVDEQHEPRTNPEPCPRELFDRNNSSNHL